MNTEMAPEVNLTKPIRLLHVVSDAFNIPFQLEAISVQLSNQDFKQRWICISKSETLEIQLLRAAGARVTFVKFRGKRHVLPALIAIVKSLWQFRPQIVHTQFQKASLMGVVLSWLFRVPVRIHTRHHSDTVIIYNTSAVWQDKVASRLATRGLAVCAVVKNVMEFEEGARADKISILSNALDTDRFTNVQLQVIEVLRDKYNPDLRKPVIGVISRWVEWKGIHFIIPAFEKILKKYPNALLVLANTTPNSPFAPYLLQQLRNIPQANYRIIIEFEPDNHALYKIFDIFVHVPINTTVEAFGQIYIEALAANVPLVATLSGIASEVLVDEENALVVPYQDSEAIYQALLRILNDEKLRNHISTSERTKLLARFDLGNWVKELEKIYLEEISKALPNR